MVIRQVQVTACLLCQYLTLIIPGNPHSSSLVLECGLREFNITNIALEL